MLEQKTIVKGLWWQEHKAANQLQGQITYGPLEGAEVDVFGQFENSLELSHTPGRFTLHGLTNDNKRVSLFECLTTGGQVRIPGGASSIISAVSGIVGGHFHSLDDVRFKQVTALFTELRDWVWTSGITTLPATDGQLINATYGLPAAIPLGQIGPLAVTIEFNVKTSPRFHSLSIEQDCALHMEAGSMQPYAVFKDCVDSFQQFLTLAVQRSAYPTKITGRIDLPKDTIADTAICDEYLIIRSRSTADSERQARIPHDFLFTSHELNSTPAETFTRFVKRQKKLAAAIDLYFSTVHNKLSLPRVRFLTLAQALEAYHRATASGLYMSDESYQNGLRKLLWNAIPKDDPSIGKDFQASLSKKLDHLHEFSLRKRLKELAAAHSAILEPLIGAPEAFATEVADTRNQLTHPSDQNHEVEDYHTLWVKCDKMALLLEVCLLNEIGFTEDRVKQIVSTRSRRARCVHEGWV